MPTIKSPCILVCVIDPASGYCFGCGRTRGEIGDWISLSDQQREEIMQILPERLENVERPPRRMTKRRRLAARKEGREENK